MIAIGQQSLATFLFFPYKGLFRAAAGPPLCCLLYRKERSMARRFIRELQAGTMVDDEVFYLVEKDLRTTNNGALYIHAVLSDKSGQVPARMWQATHDLYNLLPQEGFVKVKGRAENYKGTMQFIIEAVRPMPETEAVSIEDFLPCTDKDVDQMYKRTLEILRTVKDKHLLYLIKQFVDDKELMVKFKKAPAAVALHHAYLGGLLEHTLNLLELVLLVAPRYPQMNLDLMLTGTFLHDIGKTQELAWDTCLKYTDPGQLIGHLVIGTLLVEQKVEKTQRDLGQAFPVKLLQVLQHMILSHHGDYEFGSPKLPMTAEAMALHHLDNLDAKLDMIRREIADSEPDSDWTKYVRSLERKFYKYTNGPAGTT
jgi:3'-5' exoribonuclease